MYPTNWLHKYMLEIKDTMESKHKWNHKIENASSGITACCSSKLYYLLTMNWATCVHWSITAKNCVVEVATLWRHYTSTVSRTIIKILRAYENQSSNTCLVYRNVKQRYECAAQNTSLFTLASLVSVGKFGLSVYSTHNPNVLYKRKCLCQSH